MEQLPKSVPAGEAGGEREELSRIHEAASAAGNVVTATEEAKQHGAPFVQAAREEAEMKAAIVLAKKFPRDEAAAYTRIMHSCDRPSFAEGANYAFPRGGQVVTGPSVDLARELARIWGNVRYGLRIVTEDDERVHIKGYAYDLESNTYVESEDKFAKLVQRRNKVTRQSEWVKPDERDLRELVNKRGAICVRNAILQLLPSDIVMDAMARCRDTAQKAAKGEIQQDREAAIRRLALAYHDIGVNSEMIAGYLKHSMELITNEEIADLRAIYKSIRDGNSRREEYFVLPAYSYARPGEERQRSWSPRGNEQLPRQARSNNRGGETAGAEKRVSRGESAWDRVPELDLDEVEARNQSAQAKIDQPARPQGEQVPQPAAGGATNRPQRPVSNDPAMQSAKRNMEHTLDKVRQQTPKPEPKPAAGELPEEPEPWQEVADEAAERWETDDEKGVLRRLNRAAVALFQTPFKKLASEQLAKIMTRVNEGEINLNS